MQRRYSEDCRIGTFSMALAVIIALFVSLPGDCSALWPFSSKNNDSKESYLARVDGKIITSEEFSKALRMLHMSGRVGKAIKEKQGITAVQDYAVFLDELIDKKLMVIEAENIGLDKEKEVLADLENYTLNLLLGRLRREEVEEKIKVGESEIEEYFYEKLRKEEEEKAREETEKKEAGAKEEEGEEKEEPREMTPKDKEDAKEALRTIKTEQREKEYFSQLRRKAKVKVDEDVLEGISPDKPELMRKAVARVNGEVVTGKDLLIAMRGKVPEDIEERQKALDKLILFKLLDKEAKGRGYEKVAELKKKIASYREQLLIEQFKKNIISPLVKVEEKEILEYYDTNKEQFRESDRINLKGIRVGDLNEGKSILEELKAGADFSFLARDESLDPTAEKGGELGKVPANLVPEDVLEAFRKAAEGDVLGPFSLMDGWWVFEFHGIEKGSYLPLEKVRNHIRRVLGKQKYDAILKTYQERLRASVSVDINEAELKRLEGK